MDTKIEEKRLPRIQVKKSRQKVWKDTRKRIGAEEFHARLLIEKKVKTTTGRTAVESGLCNEEVARLLDEFCGENAERGSANLKER